MTALGDDYTVEYSLKDATGEVGRFRVGIQTLNAGSITAALALITAMDSALAGITLGTLYQKAWGDRDTESNEIPVDPAAQRENKLLVVYQDAITEARHTVTIPTIDFDALVFLPGGGDAVAFTDALGATAAMQAFVTAFEDLVVDRVTGNATEILEMRYVGRTS